MSKLLDFCESAELEHAATALARLYISEGHGRKADGLLTALRAEFGRSLAAFLTEEVSSDVSEALLAAVNEVVVQHVQYVLAKPDVSPALEAELIKTVGSLAAASVRNAELLQTLDEIELFRDFETEYRNQVSALHATMKLPHAGTTRQVPYEQLFVEPRVLIDEKPDPFRDDDRGIDVSDLIRHTTRVVILGDPGGGKSTLSRKLTHDLASGQVGESVQRTPFFVELRDYATVVRGRNRRTLIEYLEGRCRSPYNLEAPEDAIEWLLLSDRAMLILDGLDELLDTSLRRDVVEAVEGFALRYPTCPMLVTSRRVGYAEAPLDPDLFTTVQLGEFTVRQVRDYVEKWFRLDESVEASRQSGLAASFMEDSLFVSDLRENPLMLSLMCGIYASENYIPRNRPDVYEKCALLLFERWDKQRGIHAPLSFDAHVQAAMRSLALYMYKAEAEAGTGVGEVQEAREGLSRSRLVEYMRTYLREKRFDDDETAETAATEFIEFCKGRAWVLTDIGSETYGFTHQTFLEYFTASQLVRQNTSSSALYGELRPHIRSGGWDVVAQLALQILGRATEDGADDFLNLVAADIVGDSVADIYAASFALRALQFVVPRPDVVKHIVRNVADIHLNIRAALPSSDKEPGHEYDEEEKRATLAARLRSDLFALNGENTSRVGTVLREVLRDRLAQNRRDERALAMALLSSQLTNNEYWRQWSSENLTEFAEFAAAVNEQRNNVPWVGLSDLDRGKATFKQVMDWHGVESLYDYEFAGHRPTGLPFFWRFLTGRDGRGYMGLIGPVNSRRLRSIEEQIVSDLPARMTPWIPDGSPFDRWGWFVDDARKAEIGRWGLCGLLLLLPFIEARMRMQERRAPWIPNAHWARALVDARSRGGSVEDAGEVVQGLVSDSPAAARFLGSWIRGEVSVLGPEGPLRGPRPPKAGAAQLEVAT